MGSSSHVCSHKAVDHVSATTVFAKCAVKFADSGFESDELVITWVQLECNSCHAYNELFARCAETLVCRVVRSDPHGLYTQVPATDWTCKSRAFTTDLCILYESCLDVVYSMQGSMFTPVIS